jgi:hypothetical protein
MRRLLAVIIVATGCGRLGFDATSSSSDAGIDAADILVTTDGDIQPSMWAIASPQPGTTSSLWGVLANSPTDIWIAGIGGYIARFDGSTWSPSASGQQNNLFVFWAASPTDLWLAGAACTLLRWQGAAWAPVNVNGCTGQKAF